jgi:molybdenum cofactor biosynthesis enzyme MoaA
MGKLADAIKEYKISPTNSPQERAAKEIITQITESEWWKSNVGTEFKWPRKYDSKKQMFGFREPQFVFIDNFIFGRHEFCEKCRLYKGLLTYNSGQMLYAKPYIT